jgi:hypothetical protein
VEGKHDLTIRGLEAIIVGNGFRAGSVREVPRGFELAPDVSNIVIEGFVFRDMPWGVMVASIREKKTFASSFRATDRGIVLRYNTFVRVGLAVGACGPVTIEASILASDLHDVYDCSAPSSITIRASRLSSTAQRGRAILRRVDTRVDVSGELVDPPQFVDEKANDFRLKAESTCRRAGPGGGEIGAYGLPALRPPAEVVLPLPPFGLPSPSPVLVGE